MTSILNDDATGSQARLFARRPDEMRLELLIRDREVLEDLSAVPEAERETRALTALRLGIIALRQARGEVDAGSLRREADRFLAEVGHALKRHEETMGTTLASSLREYFDPESGRFHERVRRLIERDGELEQLLRRHVGGDSSELARTLTTHVGEQSELMRVLSPDESGSLLRAMQENVAKTLDEQRERILREFSLDNGEGALSRLVREIGEGSSAAQADIQKRIEAAVGEFSLDREDSALSRLVRRVEQAQKTITSEFSLDSESSALSRLRSELNDALEKQRTLQAAFQQEVTNALSALQAQRAEKERSTRHGDDFERALCELIARDCSASGDIFTETGTTTGLIRHCKTGDAVIELGRDHAAAGARIVIEAKKDQSYRLDMALSEIEEARKNRGASVGLFIFSKRCAPAGLEPLSRHGADVVAVWDADDPTTDLCLRAAVTLCRALATRQRHEGASAEADLVEMDRAILEIEKKSGSLDEIRVWAETIQSNSTKILDRVRIARDSLEKQVAFLREKIEALREP